MPTVRTMQIATAFVVIYVVFDRLAAALGSTRGEWGLVVCAVVIGLIVGVEHRLAGTPLADSVRAIGLVAPAVRALATAMALSVGLIACLPLLGRLTGTPLTVRDGAAWLAIGMFAQGGVAEETLFRGFMYRHLRQRRTFWRAACVAAVPFAVAHLPLLFALPLAVALLSGHGDRVVVSLRLALRPCARLDLARCDPACDDSGRPQGAGRRRGVHPLPCAGLGHSRTHQPLATLPNPAPRHGRCRSEPGRVRPNGHAPCEVIPRMGVRRD